MVHKLAVPLVRQRDINATLICHTRTLCLWRLRRGRAAFVCVSRLANSLMGGKQRYNYAIKSKWNAIAKALLLVFA